MTDKKPLDFEDFRFVRVTRQVLDDETYLTKPVEKLVYAVLCMYASNRTMKSHPSVATLARKSCCSENTVRSALKRLEELGLVDVKQRKNGFKNYSNEYTLWIPPACFSKGTSNDEGGYFKP